MLFKNILLFAFTVAITSAENVYLTVKSDNSEINGNSLGFPHEGAGMNYFFLGTGTPSAFTYDAEEKNINWPLTSYYNQYFTVMDNFVAFFVGSSSDEITFEDNTLALNGSTEHFYACKNTGDPYYYSTVSYELMYYTSDAPDGCISLTLVNSTVSDTTSSSTAASSATASSTENATSIYQGSADTLYAPVGAFALLAGVAAALI